MLKILIYASPDVAVLFFDVLPCFGRVLAHPCSCLTEVRSNEWASEHKTVAMGPLIRHRNFRATDGEE